MMVAARMPQKDWDDMGSIKVKHACGHEIEHEIYMAKDGTPLDRAPKDGETLCPACNAKKARDERHRLQLAELAKHKNLIETKPRSDAGAAASFKLADRVRRGDFVNKVERHVAKVIWALAYGSDHLVRALAEDHAANSLYEDERCAAEFPGYRVDRNGGEYKTRNIPSVAALDELDRIRAEHGTAHAIENDGAGFEVNRVIPAIVWVVDDGDVHGYEGVRLDVDEFTSYLIREMPAS